MSTSSKRRRASGFLLIEVLVATTLLAVGVTAALHAIFTSLRASSESRMYTQAVFLAQRVMSEIEAGAAFNSDYQVPSGGVFEDSPNYRWQASSGWVDDFWTRRISVTIIWALDQRDIYEKDKCFYYYIATEVPRPRDPEDYRK
jgi:Tfp pilus assembly protein PilV